MSSVDASRDAVRQIRMQKDTLRFDEPFKFLAH
jgi:hypothetical protein